MAERKNILVVEDDTDSRQALCTILEALGFQPLSFGSAKAALAELQTKQPRVDLAMIDIMMPEMNGYELLGQLREIPQFSQVPVIMVTAKDKDDEILEGYKYGADYYIPKPYTSKQIEYALRLYFDAGKSDTRQA